MSDNTMNLSLIIEDSRRAFRPGEKISVRVRIQCIEDWRVDYAELAVVWHSEGKGDEDREPEVLHELETKGTTVPAVQEHRVTLDLPEMPWSYLGHHIKIHYCIGVYAKAKGEKETSVEEPIVIHPEPEAVAESFGVRAE